MFCEVEVELIVMTTCNTGAGLDGQAEKTTSVGVEAGNFCKESTGISTWAIQVGYILEPVKHIA